MITETEFRLGRSCHEKVAHHRARLPRQADDAFARWMSAESGKIKALAREFFPGMRDIDQTEEIAATESTRELLKQDCCIAGAAFATEEVACHVDIMERDGDVIRVISVLPKAIDLERFTLGSEFHTQYGSIRSEWREPLEMIALRWLIVGELYPQCRVLAQIIAPLRGARCEMEGIHRFFEENDGRWRLNHPSARAEAGRLLRTFPVSKECSALASVVRRKLSTLTDAISNKRPPKIGYACRKCEFRVSEGQSGYDRCWGALGQAPDHMFHLGYLYFAQYDDRTLVADRLAQEGKVSVFDIPQECLRGEHAVRQKLQIQGMAAGREIILPELKREIDALEYPILFLDIETFRSALPAHRHVGVNSLTLFEFSVHRRQRIGAELEHFEWINVEQGNPNRAFLSALRRTLGDCGDVLVWSDYERSCFQELAAELTEEDDTSEDLRWLLAFLQSNRIRDLHVWCYRYFWSPNMLGRTSIKVVLPAVLAEMELLGVQGELKSMGNPYDRLKNDAAVADGVSAMEAYISGGKTDQLRAYVKLDTLSMVVVFDYWASRLSAPVGG